MKRRMEKSDMTCLKSVEKISLHIVLNIKRKKAGQRQENQRGGCFRSPCGRWQWLGLAHISEGS